MKLLGRCYLLLTFILLFCASFAVDDDEMSFLLAKLDAYNSAHPQEKTYLHLDKANYVAGDDLWFKAYVVDAHDGRLSEQSGILNVQLIDGQDSIVLHQKLPLSHGLTFGDLSLPDSLDEGNYRLRAYTQLMRNAPADLFFEKIIKIGNTWASKKVKIGKSTKAIANNLDIQFFPESGNLVAGIPSRIAVKCLNSHGLGQDIKGNIVDDDGTEVTDFKTTYLGMGSFVLAPARGKKYTAKIELANGSMKSIPLPIATSQGYALSINNADTSKVDVKVYLSAGLINDKDVKLVLQHNSKIQSVYKIKAHKQVATLQVQKKDLPPGIIQFTLFSSNNIPVCERLIFNKNSTDILETRLLGGSANYNKRSAVNLDLASLVNSKGVAANYSVSVTDVDALMVDPEDERNILTSLLLTADLRGFVEKPNHYFLDNRPETNTELDNLLLSQGWRRFSWEGVLKDNPTPPTYLAEEHLRIAGTLMKPGGKPLPNGRVSLISSDHGFFLIDTIADASGHFIFDKLSFPDGTRFVVQGRDLKNKKNVIVKLDVDPGPGLVKSTQAGMIAGNVNESMLAYFRKSNDYLNLVKPTRLTQNTISLKEVSVRSKVPLVKKFSSNLNGAGNADQILTSKDFETCYNVLQCLTRYIPGLVSTGQDVYFMRTPSKSVRFFLNNTAVGPDRIALLTAADVESIEVLRRAATTNVYGEGGLGGIIIVNTKPGDLQSNINTPYITSHTPKGFPPFRTFYSPVYTTTNTNNVKDLRTTVYWNPEVITDANGKAKIQFFTTDQPGNYRVIVEGINGNGQLGRTVYNYTVK